MSAAATQFLLNKLGMRGATTHDFFHRMQSHWAGAVTHSGFMLVKCQYTTLTNLWKGPFTVGGQHNF